MWEMDRTGIEVCTVMVFSFGNIEPSTYCHRVSFVRFITQKKQECCLCIFCMYKNVPLSLSLSLQMDRQIGRSFNSRNCVLNFVNTSFAIWALSSS
jgi:hypothetical protein